MISCLFLVLAVTPAILAKVATNFDDCPVPFYKGIPPNGLQNYDPPLTPICQMFQGQNNPFFASLYSRRYKIPIYSAYILDRRSGNGGELDENKIDCMPTSQMEPQRKKKKTSHTTFRVEPQLVNTRLPEYMMLQTETEKAIRNINLPGPTSLIKQNQAINSDYEKTGYDRGHLNPNADHPDGPGRTATYTLTNVAPMYHMLNCGAWKNNEENVRKIAATCDKMYVITGVIPGNNWISVKGDKRVNIPSHVWSAFCCVKNNNQPKANGSWAENGKNSVQPVTIEDLQRQLSTKLKRSITLFSNNCTGQ
ncbi:endonuclease domain-containing 1 protein-like [Dendropsophus ebraccatus]|uniref:endonuclease domain-containing 1 protein-like n=1 Tax=Dendropsophus ebraccatus TaxID=150705 RepID=UPI0038322149